MAHLVKNLEDMVKAFPLKSSSILSFILVGLEKLVDINFECPCNGAVWNGCYFAAFFIMPAVIACLVMLIIESDPWKKRCCFCFISIIVPPLVWFIMVFLDGEYFDCALTKRNGMYVQMDGDPAHKWCKPLNNTEGETELILSSKENIVISQIIGIAGLIVLSIILGTLLCQKHCMNKSNTQNGDPATNENLSSAPENDPKDEEATSAHNSVYNDEEFANDPKDEEATSAHNSVHNDEEFANAECTNL